jgi:ferric-dicitrate binding protein FerR (iron transport regulator)
VKLPVNKISEGSLQTLAVRPQEIVERLSWTLDMQMFVDKPLAYVVQEVNHYARSKLVIGDPALADCKVGLTLHKGNVSELSRMLYQQLSICSSDYRLRKCTSEETEP